MANKKIVVDGNEAAAYVSYAFTEVAGIFPITPSSPMAEHVDEWAALGKKNIFGQTVDVAELQSEGGAAGSVHGSLQAGALTTTYTASQGLLLMIPNMYKIAGELLPGVFHVSARTLSAHALSIFGDHSDVMACRQTGFALLASANPQEVMDLGAVAHLAAIKGRVPFLHFFDGFRTSHEIQKIDALDYEDLAGLVDLDALKRFRKNSLNPERPCTRGATQNPDVFFQLREASNNFYAALPGIVEGYMDEINKLTGKNYKLFNYYGAPDAKRVVVAMGSVIDTIQETVDYLTARGEKVGVLCVRLYRPFSAEHFLAELPQSVEKLAVLDRTKETGSQGEPLYQDVCQLCFKRGKKIDVIGGRYGLSSKDTTPAQICAAFDNLKKESSKENFTIGIEDDVTGLSLPIPQQLTGTSPKGTISCKIWGLGSDGTVGANKNTIKIIGGHTDLYTQAYFVYDSKKSGGLTQSHLRFGKEEIKSTYLVSEADFVACHNQSYVDRYNLTGDLKKGSVFLLNCQWDEKELEEKLPPSLKRDLAEKKIRFYIINAVDIAKDLGLGGRTNTVLQAAFFKLVPILPLEDAVRYMKDSIKKTYSRKGEQIVAMNWLAVDRGIELLKEIAVPPAWKQAVIEEKDCDYPDFIKKVVIPMNRQEGDAIPVSAFIGREDGTWPAGTTKYEKRGAAVDIPKWNGDKCIQCNQCSYVCPHAAIRPILLDKNEAAKKPKTFETIHAKGKGLTQYQYRIQVSPLDCTGCGSCAYICPAKEKALSMKSLASQIHETKNWNYSIESVSIKEDAIDKNTVKGSQFAQPLFEFSGACAGCGETPYVKLISQLFGDRMYCANASGCSTAFSGSTPSTPYTTNKDGCGPAWAMSLFEDTAEYIYGMYMGAEKIRERLTAVITELSSIEELKGPCRNWLEKSADPDCGREAANELARVLTSYENKTEAVSYVIENREYLTPKSYWGLGGDGWAYDIGYGGLDHVLASGKNINLFVLDTEVYSNTGGQASKATATGAIAKFASDGKKTKKKDLGLMAMSYGYVYVAQVAMGYDMHQTLKAIREAESYDGPSLIIAYCPCIEHGMKCGMSQGMGEAKRAVEAGYWHTYRYNPDLKKQGQNPFILDSKEPTGDLKEFMMNEVRYASLKKAFPETAEQLFDKAEKDAKERYQTYLQLAGK
ncbi:MAG: pyruvate:ferredoxin (flavodoxin) oxidoreductase [Clostridiales Family XIII bacterium]|nr:pyruvate:ferredoxin (flavodoxin) oxidoreductase [Clostridia bacterium]MDY3012283.1 pyruvate:ferredoxin (flavodoxin) oxidoreductase [Clostridiales Family XIII bacterium]